MRGTLLRIAAAALSAAALFAGGHVCAHLVHPPGDPATLRVTLTLYDQDGRPLCQSERSVQPQGQLAGAQHPAGRRKGRLFGNCPAGRVKAKRLRLKQPKPLFVINHRSA